MLIHVRTPVGNLGFIKGTLLTGRGGLSYRRGVGGRLGRHSEGGVKKCAQQKKNMLAIIFCAPFYISNQYFDIQ